MELKRKWLKLAWCIGVSGGVLQLTGCASVGSPATAYVQPYPLDQVQVIWGHQPYPRSFSFLRQGYQFVPPTVDVKTLAAFNHGLDQYVQDVAPEVQSKLQYQLARHGVTAGHDFELQIVPRNINFMCNYAFLSTNPCAAALINHSEFELDLYSTKSAVPQLLWKVTFHFSSMREWMFNKSLPSQAINQLIQAGWIPEKEIEHASDVVMTIPVALKVVSSQAKGSNIEDVNAVPYLNEEGRSDYQEWLGRAAPRAFAIAEDGTHAGAWGGDGAEYGALEDCQSQTKATCRIYAKDNRVVWSVDSGKDSGK